MAVPVGSRAEVSVAAGCGSLSCTFTSSVGEVPDAALMLRITMAACQPWIRLQSGPVLFVVAVVGPSSTISRVLTWDMVRSSRFWLAQWSAHPDGAPHRHWRWRCGRTPNPGDTAHTAYAVLRSGLRGWRAGHSRQWQRRL